MRQMLRDEKPRTPGNAARPYVLAAAPERGTCANGKQYSPRNAHRKRAAAAKVDLRFPS